MVGTSLNITDDLIKRLKEIIPAAFTEDKINVEQLRQLIGEAVNTDTERYQLNWAGKNEAYKVLQSPTTATLVPMQEDSNNWNDAQHILIEGENLEALKILQKSYYGKVKVVCIDPPYNTGSDSFIYPDKFSETKEEYLKRISEKDEEGLLMKEGLFRPNRKENGQFHSNWLSMMLPRLFLARNLMKQDGLIFVHIDDNEITNLRLLMNEVFGEENYVQEIVWQRHAGGGNDSKYFAVDHEFILCYAKDLSAIDRLRLPFDEKDIANYKLKDKHYEKLGPYKTKSFLRMRPDDPRPGLQYKIKCPDDSMLFGEWKWEEQSFLDAYKEDKVLIRKDDKGKWSVEYKLYLNAEDGEEKQKVPRSLFLNEARNSQGKQTLTKILGKANIFNNPKPIELLKVLINLGTSTDGNDIVLDFFGGSGSTGQAVIELNEEQNSNRKFILIQLPEKTDINSEAYKEGFTKISDITRKRISNVIENLTTTINSKLNFENKALPGFRFFTLNHSNFKIWRGDIIENEKDLITQIEIFKKPQRENTQEYNILWELMIKNGISLDSPVLEKKIDKSIIYHFTKQTFCFCLSSITDKVIAEIVKMKPSQLICLDSTFNNEDCNKTNIQLKLQDNGIELKSI